MITYIKSKDNPQIKFLAKLLSSKKARTENGLFVIEGMRNCMDAAFEAQRGNISLKSVFCEEKHSEQFVKTFEGKTDVFVISEEIVRKISAENNSQGVFAVAQMLHKRFDDDAVCENGMYVVLNHLQDPGNIGTILRTADAMGLSGVVLTNNCCDIYNPKVVRAAMGSMARVAIYLENDFLTVCRVFSRFKIKTAAAVVGQGTEIRDYDFSGGCAVCLGNEGNGLEKAHAELCDDKITIAMNGNIESLNAAVAGAIIMWEMSKKQVFVNG